MAHVRVVFDVVDYAINSSGRVCELFTQLKESLDSKNKRKANNTMDALIGEVAIVNGYTLLTGDRDLADVVRALGGLADFVESKPLADRTS